MKTKFIFSVVISFVLLGCSPKVPESKDIIIQNSEVYGEDADLISVIPNTYILKKKDNSLRIAIQLKLEKSTDKKIVTYPELIFKDEDGVDILNGWYQMGLSDEEKFHKFISSAPGTVMEFIFVNEFNDDYFYKIMSSSHYFTLNNILLEKPQSNKSGINVIDDNISDELEEVIEVIDEYEELLEDTADAIEALDDISDWD